jgi:hypothetical protein
MGGYKSIDQNKKMYAIECKSNDKLVGFIDPDESYFV